MSRLLICLLTLVLAGCSPDSGPGTSTDSKTTAATAETLLPLVKEYAFREEPDLDPSTQVEIVEYKVPGLVETLGIRLLLANYRSPNGHWYDDKLLIYRDGQLKPFANTFGGYGLMSAVMSEDALYYTYSWGSGRHFSHVARLTINDGAVEIVESAGFVYCDLFVREVEGKIQVESGQFHEFNSWSPEEVVGGIRVKASSLAVVNAEGEELDPFLFHVERQPQPSGQYDTVIDLPSS